MTTVFFADENCLLMCGAELGRTDDGQVAVRQEHAIAVVHESRVFATELECCNFILGSLSAQYQLIADRADIILQRRRELAKGSY